MSVAKYQHELRDLPGIEAATMRYEDGGKVEVWTIGGKEVRVRAGATSQEIREAFNG